MLKLRDFLEIMPKGALKTIHEKLLGKQGIISNTRLLQECVEQLEDLEQLHAWYATLAEWQKEVLSWVAMSQKRGISRAELTIAVGHERTADLAEFLQQACERVAIYRADHYGVFAYYAFADFAHEFVSVDSTAVSGKESWFSNENKVLWMLIRLCSIVAKGELRINNNLDLHRRSQQLLQEISALPEYFASSNDYWFLFLLYCHDQEWLQIEDAVVNLNARAFAEISVHPQKLVLNLLDWWANYRLDGNVELLQRMFANPEQSLDLSRVHNLWWATDPQSSEAFLSAENLRFERLNKVLREMWILGMVEFSQTEGHLDQVRLTRRGQGWLFNAMADMEFKPLPATSMPNFELLIPAMSNPAYLLVAASIGEILAEDEYIRIVISKDDYIAGLKTNIPQEWFTNFYQWISLPPNVQETLHLWHQILFGSWIRPVLLLRIHDEKKWQELHGFPTFKDCVQESIPNWGFVLHENKQKKARDLLESFGLVPATDKSGEDKATSFKKGDWIQKVAIARFNDVEIDYDPYNTEDYQTSTNSQIQKSKYGTEFQALSGLELNNVMRYAALMEIPIEVEHRVVVGKKKSLQRQTMVVKEVHARREPYYIEGMFSDGTPAHIELENVVQFRLTKV